jgi:hypothetical protein
VLTITPSGGSAITSTGTIAAVIANGFTLSNRGTHINAVISGGIVTGFTGGQILCNNEVARTTPAVGTLTPLPTLPTGNLTGLNPSGSGFLGSTFATTDNPVVYEIKSIGGEIFYFPGIAENRTYKGFNGSPHDTGGTLSSFASVGVSGGKLTLSITGAPGGGLLGNAEDTVLGPPKDADNWGLGARGRITSNSFTAPLFVYTKETITLTKASGPAINVTLQQGWNLLLVTAGVPHGNILSVTQSSNLDGLFWVTGFDDGTDD